MVSEGLFLESNVRKGYGLLHFASNVFVREEQGVRIFLASVHNRCIRNFPPYQRDEISDKAGHAFPNRYISLCWYMAQYWQLILPVPIKGIIE
jgi:hypothetical protein